VAEALTGFTYTHRWPEDRPTANPFMLGDSTCGTAAAGVVFLALYDRERTGGGRQIDIALYEPLMVMMGDIVARYTALGLVPEPTGSRSMGASPRGQAWVERYDRDEVFEIPQNAEVPVGKLYTGKDIAEDAHFRERGSIPGRADEGAIGPFPDLGLRRARLRRAAPGR
jgi:crotonobetainyl-CoA:carnitine CoA-transferase CaiB-like acyl-CoA transferase